MITLLRNELEEKQQLYNCASFDIDVIPQQNFRHMFRFDREDIIRLHAALQMPLRWETPHRHVIGGVYETEILYTYVVLLIYIIYY
jgi:hypothetical protein